MTSRRDFALPRLLPALPPEHRGECPLRDVFNNQLDGEFRANKTADGLGYEDLLANGQYRNGLSGDGIQGGSFVTGYTVAPSAKLVAGHLFRNVIFARPDYIDDPFNVADDPDGTLAKPFAALATESLPNNQLNGGDLNSQNNFGTGFNSSLDRNGDGHFTRSAFYEAQQAARFNPGPVIVIAEPGTVVRDPISGNTTRQSFVLQAPSGSDPLLNDGSASVPEMTTLVFQAGSALKMLNASLFVQNQGSALQMRGGSGASQIVNVTSYKDDSVGGDTNRDLGDSTPLGGDFGGIVFRNYDQTNRGLVQFPGQIPNTGNAITDGRLRGPNTPNGPTGVDAISGSDDVMSYLDNSRVRFGGGIVPQTNGTPYDAISLINARTSVSNTAVSESGGATGAQAGLSGNVDSFREDQILRGPIIRRVTLTNNSINGIYVRGELNGVAEATDAIHYPLNPSTLAASGTTRSIPPAVRLHDEDGRRPGLPPGDRRPDLRRGRPPLRPAWDAPEVPAWRGARNPAVIQSGSAAEHQHRRPDLHQPSGTSTRTSRRARPASGRRRSATRRFCSRPSSTTWRRRSSSTPSPRSPRRSCRPWTPTTEGTSSSRSRR